MAAPSANPSPHKIAFVGHSLIRDLGQFVENHAQSNIKNFGFSKNQVELKFISKSGLKIREILQDEPESLLRIFELTQFKPHTIVLGIGDNDIVRGASETFVANELKRLAERLMQAIPGVSKLVILKLMPRNIKGSCRYLFHGYNQMASRVNNLLHVAVNSLNDISFHRIEWPFPHEKPQVFKNRCQTCYKRDGVHFTDLGLRKMAHGVRAVVVRSLFNRL